MDKVRIERLETEAIIGVYEFEHEAPQPLVIDLELGTDFTNAFRSDDLNDALDYEAISNSVREFTEASRFALLEALAGGIIQRVLDNFPVEKVGVFIRKPHALKGALATVFCERTREQMDMQKLMDQL
ncbi:dihydroneopterin aldolase [Endozoicomonas euniceicola]|uniref:7,8-dihydroneopterin aldolase n=1 Tax=Endozoicomonas euniceicola TaxID=1234143 RepID=A0ABY6GNB0_9GAMM|nr:dihydroneopterin aldolase [Endozoicomonas euniceicola]UYM14225.1 dihydroneopterin aldolase [Endozoicomonas euniceicola]